MNICRVFIYDDHPRRIESLTALMELTNHFVVVGSAKNCILVSEDMASSLPDIVLMDINMPEKNGLEGLKVIKTERPEIKVLMQTAFDDDEKIFTSIKNGASGYILKSDSPDQILKAIAEVNQGGAAMNPAIAMRIIEHFRPNKHAQKLSPKELQVLELLAEGLSYKMVAHKLEISYATVNSHAKSIYEKLHISSMGEAIAFYYKNIK